MPIKISGVDVAKVLVGSGGGASPAQKIMLGTGSSAVQVWQAVRQVTITSTYKAQNYIWNVDTAVGAVEIMIPSSGDTVLRFAVDVTCDSLVNNSITGNQINAGTIIPAGYGVRSRGTGAVTFTEVI